MAFFDNDNDNNSVPPRPDLQGETWDVESLTPTEAQSYQRITKKAVNMASDAVAAIPSVVHAGGAAVAAAGGAALSAAGNYIAGRGFTNVSTNLGFEPHTPGFNDWFGRSLQKHESTKSNHPALIEELVLSRDRLQQEAIQNDSNLMDLGSHLQQIELEKSRLEDKVAKELKLRSANRKNAAAKDQELTTLRAELAVSKAAVDGTFMCYEDCTPAQMQEKACVDTDDKWEAKDAPALERLARNFHHGDCHRSQHCRVRNWRTSRREDESTWDFMVYLQRVAGFVPKVERNAAVTHAAAAQAAQVASVAAVAARRPAPVLAPPYAAQPPFAPTAPGAVDEAALRADLLNNLSEEELIRMLRKQRNHGTMRRIKEGQEPEGKSNEEPEGKSEEVPDGKPEGGPNKKQRTSEP